MVHSIILDYDIQTTKAMKMDILVEEPIMTIGNLRSGIAFPLNKLTIITESELFTKAPKRIRKKQNITNAERIKNNQELKDGDYVVYASHVVGKYLRIETVEVNRLNKN